MASPPTRPRRTHRETTQATTSALLDAARELFAADGYAATSLDRVAAHAGVTKGALYHHFAGKAQLFEAVFGREQERLMQTIVEAAARHEDPWRAVEAAVLAFLDACLDPGVQRIVLLDAPAALGWARVRELEAAGIFALLRGGVERTIREGRIAQRPVDPLAHLLFGAVCEGVMSIARLAEGQPAAARATRAELRRLFAALGPA